ncbi:MAG: endonuclease MutS2 [Peptococcaceae bacterium]|nr:endonuclease MutS2 [Peptococcaceae bacterium]
MNQKTLKRLEYSKIIEQLAKETISPLGRELALNLEPVDNMHLIKKWLSETTEGRELLRLDPVAEIGGWYDIREQVENCRRGILLEPEELISVGRTVSSIKKIKKFFLEKQETYPLLAEISGFLGYFADLDQRINSAILPGGEVADNASPALAQIRRQLINAQGQVKSRLENYIRSAAYQKYLQDPIVTIRENRYVIPVKQEYRSQISGIVHDQSASGATLFIEPMAVVEANNEARRLQVSEKQEIFRILSELSSLVAGVADDLMVSLESLAQLEFIIAKARYSIKLDAWEPKITSGFQLNIVNGRHPLLTGKVVPISVNIGDHFDTLVITGPNTGGKTVALKTIGLLVLMAQSGLHIPCDEGSVLGVFSNLYADIGDEQSIEQSLSTFSSHMTNIVDIIGKAGQSDLVLLDELGSGTDPTEGSALAKAILEKLHSSGAKTIATTHYGELKSFAYANNRIENASVEFDNISLRPTYKLLIGQPGRSNAFEIATRLGMAQDLVDRSRQFMTEDQIKAANLMDQLEKSCQQAQQDQEEAARVLAEARELKRNQEERERSILEKNDASLAKAKEEALNTVREARRQAEEMIKKLRESLSSQAAREREMGIQEVREQLTGMEAKNKQKLRRRDVPQNSPKEIYPGQEVFIPRFNQKGFVLTRAENDQVQIQIGVMKIMVSISDIRELESVAKSGGELQIAKIMATKARDISTNLDLRGLNSEEALSEMDKYLDDARLAGLPRVNIIHGKGTGALRVAVQEHLQSCKVKSYRLGEGGEGGEGCTVVYL